MCVLVPHEDRVERDIDSRPILQELPREENKVLLSRDEILEADKGGSQELDKGIEEGEVVQSEITVQ